MHYVVCVLFLLCVILRFISLPLSTLGRHDACGYWHCTCALQALLACDGLWDVIDCTRVDKLVRMSLEKRMSTKEICEQLVRVALERGSRDNISVMLVLLPKQRPPQFAQHTAATREQLATNVGHSLVTHMVRIGVEISARMLHVARLREHDAQTVSGGDSGRLCARDRLHRVCG